MIQARLNEGMIGHLLSIPEYLVIAFIPLGIAREVRECIIVLCIQGCLVMVKTDPVLHVIRWKLRDIPFASVALWNSIMERPDGM